MFAQRQINHGFTLVEILVVVLIIAILALLALPNMHEAQTRARVARARADLRSIAIALEAYATDERDYPPNDGVFNVVPAELTTPVAYLMTNRLSDPFSERAVDPIFGELARFYTYDLILTHEQWLELIDGGAKRLPPVEAVDSPLFNPGALEKYGRWRLVSNGPDGRYADPAFVPGSDPADPNGVLLGADVPYDPTNGTASKGNIMRTQRAAETVRR